MVTIKRLLIVGALLIGLVIPLAAQGDVSAQVLRLLSRANYWTNLNTFSQTMGLKLERGVLAPQVSITDRIYNVNGTLFFNGSAVAGGVATVTAGTNVTITGTATNPIISATGGGGGGVTSITAGAGITVGGTASVPIVAITSVISASSCGDATHYPAIVYNARGQLTTVTCTAFSGAPHNLLSATHPDTVVSSPVRGGIIIANSTPAWAQVALGTSGYFVGSNGTDTVYTNNGSQLINLNASNISTGTVGGSVVWNAGAVTTSGTLSVNGSTIALKPGGNVNVTGSTIVTNGLTFGTNYLTVDYSSGSIGIGSAAPGTKLEVVGTARITGMVVGDNVSALCCANFNLHGDMRIYGASSGYVGFVASAASSNTEYTWPSGDGSNGYILSTDGAGNLAWIGQAGAGGPSLSANNVWTGSNTFRNVTIAASYALATNRINATTGNTITFGAGTGDLCVGGCSLGAGQVFAGTGNIYVNSLLGVGTKAYMDTAFGGCTAINQLCAPLAVDTLTQAYTIVAYSSNTTSDGLQHQAVYALMGGDGARAAGVNVGVFADMSSSAGGMQGFLGKVRGGAGSDYGLHLDIDNATEYPVYISNHDSADAMIFEVTPAGQVLTPSMNATTAGGGIYVCIDTNGKLYKKAACP